MPLRTFFGYDLDHAWKHDEDMQDSIWQFPCIGGTKCYKPCYGYPDESAHSFGIPPSVVFRGMLGLVGFDGAQVAFAHLFLFECLRHVSIASFLQLMSFDLSECLMPLHFCAWAACWR